MMSKTDCVMCLNSNLRRGWSCIPIALVATSLLLGASCSESGTGTPSGGGARTGGTGRGGAATGGSAGSGGSISSGGTSAANGGAIGGVTATGGGAVGGIASGGSVPGGSPSGGAASGGANAGGSATAGAAAGGAALGGSATGGLANGGAVMTGGTTTSGGTSGSTALGPIKVSTNGRYLQSASGTPFFWLADTCWLLTQKLDRSAVQNYFEDRRTKGFNVVQIVPVQTLTDKNSSGDAALMASDSSLLNITTGSDPANAEQYDYWDHVDFVVETAAANGIYLAIALTWREPPGSAAQPAAYVGALVDRLKDRPNLIWMLGGSAKGSDNLAAWKTIGELVKRQDPVHLVTFHPFGRTQSSAWFHDTPWLDFNTFVSGHQNYAQDTSGKMFGEDNWRYVLEDVAKVPLKPTLDSEPSYENTPQGLHDATQPYWQAGDVRRYAYWSVFAGSAGHTYGENSVRQVYLPSDLKSSSGAKGYFAERLNTDGAKQMIYLKNLILSRPYFDRVGDQSLVAGTVGEKYERILVTRGSDWLAAYTYTGRTFDLKLGAISGAKLTATWYNPRTGETTVSGSHDNTGTATFDPPGAPSPGNDWVLVLDDASKNFGLPGQGLAR